ncbi:hypothetical protein JKF63_07802 [Porcisia hertigi]|uniref:Uncharacterized protein n=1 Tax=Porcisia hertigi TaxID=2761500 RepID=A0A836YGI2_9TRYP|nr:hypothetical protein JKF63_07802 [Porcisia hertigi]
MYRTTPQILFQFVGGLSIAQLAFPILHDAITSKNTSSSNVVATATPGSSGTLSGVWGSLKWNLGPPTGVHGTLADDIEALLRTHCWVASAILSFTLLSGGTPALLGGGLSVYCNSSPEGKARYSRLKQQFRSFSEAGNQT